MWFLALALACGGAPASPDVAPSWGAPRETQARKYIVELALDPEPPPAGELFSTRATVRTRDGAPVPDAKVTLDARMPQHGHGMETAPVPRPGDCDDAGVCVHPGGVYVSDGFKFHMPGAWTLTVQIEGPLGPDDTSFVYELK